VQASHGLTQDEVEQLVLESVEHAHQDFTTRRLIELRNKADADLRHTEKALAQAGDQLSAGQRQQIEEARTRLRLAMRGDDVDALQKAVAAFGDATLPLAQIVMDQVATAALRGKGEKELDTEAI
jgi:molecular chaperone DnaK